MISPGPCTPQEAGISVELIQKLGGKIPILGVCLGHQAIGAAYGAKIIRAPKLFHGKTSEIQHDGKGIFHKLPNPFTATRYHSLIVERKSLPRGIGRSQRKRATGSSWAFNTCGTKWRACSFIPNPCLPKRANNSCKISWRNK